MVAPEVLAPLLRAKEFSMATPTTIPVTILPEAAARIAELGMQREYDEMLQHALQAIPALRSIEVQLAPPYDTGDDPRVVIEATTDLDAPGIDQAEKQWGDWVINTFPSAVWAHFRMLTMPGTP